MSALSLASSNSGPEAFSRIVWQPLNMPISKMTSRGDFAHINFLDRSEDFTWPAALKLICDFGQLRTARLSQSVLNALRHSIDFMSGKPNASSDRFDWSRKRDRRLMASEKRSALRNIRPSSGCHSRSIEIVMAPLKAEPDCCGGSLRRDR